MQIQQRNESPRGCGTRQPGGKYLISGGRSAACGKLPIPITPCGACGATVKFSRGFQWVEEERDTHAYNMVINAPCRLRSYVKRVCEIPGGCPLDGRFDGRFGIMWVGEKHYSPEEFTQEAEARGVSKRISAVPKGLELGQTWVLFAHKKAIPPIVKGDQGEPGIFYAFRPTALEYIVDKKDTDAKLKKLEKEGFTLIDVLPQQTEI